MLKFPVLHKAIDVCVHLNANNRHVEHISITFLAFVCSIMSPLSLTCSLQLAQLWSFWIHVSCICQAISMLCRFLSMPVFMHTKNHLCSSSMRGLLIETKLPSYFSPFWPCLSFFFCSGTCSLKSFCPEVFYVQDHTMCSLNFFDRSILLRKL